MSSDRVEGLTVRVREGRTLGVVVGVFAEGPLAGRLRVHGDDALGPFPAGPQAGKPLVPSALRVSQAEGGQANPQTQRCG